jgi:simple sugar transport system permease protein
MIRINKIIPNIKSWMNTKSVQKNRLISGLNGFWIYLAAVIAALTINSGFIAWAGGNIISSYQTMIQVSLGSLGGIGQTLNKCTPLLLAGIAVAVGNRGRVANIGSDGQIYMGAIFGTGVGLLLVPLNMPIYVLSPLVLLASIIGGAFWCGIAGVLKARFGTSELFTTIMLLFIANFITDYFASGPWRAPEVPDSISRPIATSGFLPKFPGGAHVGIIIAIVVAIAVYFLIEKSVLGYKIRTMGDNPEAAKLAGINIPLYQFGLLTLSGAIAGLAGGIEIAGLNHRLMTGLSPSYGLMAVLVASLGKNKPIGVIISAFLFAVLIVGSDSLQRSINLPSSAVMVFQAVVYLSILLARTIREK